MTGMHLRGLVVTGEPCPCKVCSPKPAKQQVRQAQPMSRKEMMTRKQMRRFMGGVPAQSAMVHARSPNW